MKKRKSAKFHNIFFNALLKMRPGHFIHNPMLFIIFIFACAATLLLIREIQFATVNVALYFQMTFWIWMTLYFSTFADSYAESKMHYIDEDYNNQDKSVIYIKKIPSLKNMDDIREIEYNEVKSGNLILLKSGI